MLGHESVFPLLLAIDGKSIGDIKHSLSKLDTGFSK